MIFASIHLNHRQRFFALLILLIGLLSACVTPASPQTTTENEAVAEETVSETDNPHFPLTVSDATGQEFTFDAPPRLGCLWYGCHEIMADLGLAPTASSIGLDQRESPFFFPSGPAEYWIDDAQNPEMWASAEVDIILTRGPASPAQDAIKAAAPIFYLHGYNSSDLHGLDEYLANYQLMGQLTGKPEAAEAALARFEAAVAGLRSLAPADAAEIRFDLLGDYQGYYIATQDQPFCQVIQENDLGVCAGPEAALGGESGVAINAEELLSINPDWIAFNAPDAATLAERSDPVWLELNAVKEGHVYATGPTPRYGCCSLRGFIFALQQYGHYVYAGANIPDPGPLDNFDPLQSILVNAQ